VVNRTYRWGLAALKLRPGNILTYRAKATDNRPLLGTPRAPRSPEGRPEPNVGFSAAHTIVITSPRYDLDRDIRREQIARIKRAMARLKEQLKGAKNNVAPMKKYAAERNPIQEWQDRNKKAAQEHLKNAAPLAKDLTGMLEKDPLLDVLTPKSRDIETKHIPEAQKATDKVQANRPLHLSEKPIEKADKELDEALRKLDEMAAEMKRLEAQEEEERRIAELADREDRLAAEAEKVPPDQRQLANQLADRQDLLKDILDKIMDEQFRQDAIQQGMEEFKDLHQDIKDLLGKEKDLKGRTEEEIRKKLDELKQRQRDLNQEAQAAKPNLEPKLDDRKAGKIPEDAMKNALQAMEENKFPQAVKQQKEAEDQMRRQADALGKPVPKREGQPEKPAAARDAERVKEMADEQENIRRELAALVGIPQPDRRLEDIQRRQEALKRDAEALEQQAAPQVNKQQPRGQKAPEEMQQAVNEMKRMTPRQALPHQEEAAKQLDELAQNLQQRAEAAKPEEQGPPKQMARQARDLAGEQRDLKEELEEALPQRAPQMQRLAQEQMEIEQDARDLGARMEELAGALEQVLPEAGQQARKAQKAMGEAPEHMEAAAQDLHAGQAEPATADEQKAIDALARADMETGKLADQLAQAVEEMMGEPQEGNPMIGLALAKALAQMKDASALMRLMETRQGSQIMRSAARHLASAAEQMMQRGLPFHMPSQTFDPRGIRGRGRKPGDLEDLQLLELTAEEWNRLPGELKQQLLQAMKGKYPEEYRQLIRDYFRRLAKTGVKLDRKK